ncbi:protein RKD1-like [Vigna angularis]|uniref:protein RKD1-like n=1 Tax=Phaseolus angularis TaxID=3914 RepID=UPI0022B35AAE|nr:protein RKD1-like [Vigna angularis]
MENQQLTFWNSNYQIDENSFAPTCQFSYDYFRGNASDGFHWPYEFPLQDSYFDVVPFMKCYYPHDILYETLPLEPTPLSFQDYDFSDVKNVLSAWNEVDVSDHKPAFSSSNDGGSVNETMEEVKGKQHREERISSSARILSRKTVSQYFYMPISQAAKELNVGLTHLKKRCRELGIQRWPHRKLMSLQTLIKNMQEQVQAEGPENDEKIRTAIDMLEKEKSMVEEKPDLELEDKTRRLRQACFKANYKKRKLMTMTFMESNLPLMPYATSIDKRGE